MSTDRETRDLESQLHIAGFPWVEAQRIAGIVIAAGWMPRPEPGSPEWEAMVERAARELIPDGETPSEGILERAEVMLRAALVTGGAAED